MRVLRSAAALSFATLTVACRSTPQPTPPQTEASAAGAGLRYEVLVADSGNQVDVTLCFDGDPGPALIPNNKAGVPYINHARIVGSQRRLVRSRGRLSLEGVAPGDCIEYDVNLAEVAKGEGLGSRVRVQGDSLLVRTSMWLWRPLRLPDDVETTIAFTLPPSVNLSVPWPTAPGSDRTSRTPRFRVDRTALTWLSYTVLGTLRTQQLEAAGADIEVVVLDDQLDCSQPGLQAWASDAAQSVATLYGSFPRKRLQVVVVPVEGGSGTVYFGMAARGGGSSVFILMDRQAQDGDLLGGWTTVHEFLHHGMPFVEDAWMAEGWVSYYTELTRTRIGNRSELQGWQALWDAFERGRSTRRGLSLEKLSQNMSQTFAFQRVYWGGAAIALLTDVALRSDSNNQKSLDDAMKYLRSCCGEAKFRWDAQVLLKKLDQWYGKPIFTSIANEHLPNPAFPPVERAMDQLGIVIEDGRVRLDDDHPGAKMRRGLMLGTAP